VMDIPQVVKFMVSIIMSNKKSVNEKLSEALDVEFEKKVKEIEVKRKVIRVEVDASDSKKDYWLVRENMKELISTGEDAIEGILKVATEGDSPRAYEVAAQMITTVSEANKDLIDLHQKMKVINKEEVNIHNTTNNSLYIGSTKELQNLINTERSTNKKKLEGVHDVVIDGEVIDNDD